MASVFIETYKYSELRIYGCHSAVWAARGPNALLVDSKPYLMKIKQVLITSLLYNNRSPVAIFRGVRL